MENVLMWAAGIIISAGFGVTGWVLNMVLAKIEKNENHIGLLERSFHAHKVHAAETFATKSDVRDMTDRVMKKLDSIDDKLDRKADK